MLNVSCDSVILAVGESVDRDFCRGTGLEITRNGMLEVDRYALTTSRDKVFAGGDFVTGASNVTTAMGWGKDAARNIDHHLMGESRYDCVMPVFAVRPDAAATRVPADATTHISSPPRSAPRPSRRPCRHCAPDEAHEEASRCLRCDIRETMAHAVSRR